MKKQYIVFGIDRFGASVAHTLEENGCQVIAVDKDSEKVQQIADEVSYAMTADVQDPDAVSSLGLKNVDGAVISIVNHMEASIIAAMVCQEMGVKMIIARAANEMHARILEKIGVTKVVTPEQEMGERIGRYIAAQDFMDWIALSPDYALVELPIEKDWLGKNLAELQFRSRYGLNVVGVRKGADIQMQIDPNAPLKDGDILIVIGSNERLKEFTK